MKHSRRAHRLRQAGEVANSARIGTRARRALDATPGRQRRDPTRPGKNRNDVGTRRHIGLFIPRPPPKKNPKYIWPPTPNFSPKNPPQRRPRRKIYFATRTNYMPQKACDIFLPRAYAETTTGARAGSSGNRRGPGRSREAPPPHTSRTATPRAPVAQKNKAAHETETP